MLWGIIQCACAAGVLALIEAGLPAAGMPPTPLDGGDLTALVAYIRSGLDVNARGCASVCFPCPSIPALWPPVFSLEC